MPDYYEILGLARQAEASEIKQAYRKLAKRYHPDVNHGNPDAESRFKQIVEAYETLSDEARRASYDEHLNRGRHFAQEQKNKTGERSSSSTKPANGEPFDPARVKQQFNQFFGMSPQGQKTPQSKKESAKERNPLDTSELFEHFFGYRKK